MALGPEEQLGRQALTYNEQLLDAAIRHQIGLLRMSGSIRNRLWELLDETEADIRRQVEDRIRRGARGALTAARLRQTERLLAALRETRNAAWNRVDAELVEQMRALVFAEPEFQAATLRTVLPVELGLTIPPASRLRAIVTNHPFVALDRGSGRTLRSWLRKIRREDLERLEGAVRVGLVQGETGPQIARRLVGRVRLRGRDGATQVTRRAAATLTRSAVSAIGSQARREFNAANADIVGAQEFFVATLDSRTTPICRSLDGNLYEIGRGPVLPLHPNERSIYAVVVDGRVLGRRPVREFTQRQLLREFAEREGIRAPRTRAALPRGTKGAFDRFARRRMRELTGTAPAKLTYAQFLRRQSAQFQDDILGRTRGRLFRRGGLTLDKFVDREGSEIPLRDLARFEAEAFRAAGLDPGDFF